MTRRSPHANLRLGALFALATALGCAILACIQPQPLPPGADRGENTSGSADAGASFPGSGGSGADPETARDAGSSTDAARPDADGQSPPVPGDASLPFDASPDADDAGPDASDAGPDADADDAGSDASDAGPDASDAD